MSRAPNVALLPFSPVGWDNQCGQLLPENSNQCGHPEVPTGTLTQPLWQHPPPRPFSGLLGPRRRISPVWAGDTKGGSPAQRTPHGSTGARTVQSIL